MHRDTRAGSLDRAGLIKQIFRVVARIVPTSDDCSIASFFGEHRELALQPLRQWMKPEDASIQTC
jgi:hypothetical protein